ncbi:putative oxidoreductase [Pararhizobium capsulatum DSM 1112]|uniref:Oxidoreductase n=1 Tax=Pararhizobium capsulatum DSM 1112 TaxID=1121113 RepID=A0ABU0C051_9HYPH|nr:Ldh family oxidoreductase [Pararhizobium capsulatum]MDQ0323891.1 putative oxidoreductase [Pararhizobium capsulatum DSM 1112]
MAQFSMEIMRLTGSVLRENQQITKNEKNRFCPPDDMQLFISSAFTHIGMPTGDADFMADVIIASELSGHECHGVRRFPEYISRAKEGFCNPSAKLKIEKDSGVIIVADGQRAYGNIVMRDATDIAIARAKQHGVAIIAVKGCDSGGRLADYCERAADVGVVTMFFANESGGGQQVSPPGGIEARMSTNPLAFGIPRAAKPHLVLDMSTSTVAFGRLSETIDRGEQPPAEWVNSVGVLRHFGGHKGFGLAIVVEALAGALTGGGTANENPETEDQAFLLISFDVEHFRGLNEFTAELERFLCHVKDVTLEEGAKNIRIPGEGSLDGNNRMDPRGILLRPIVFQRIRQAMRGMPIRFPTSLQ